MTDSSYNDHGLDRWTRRLAVAIWVGLMTAAWILATRGALGGLPGQLTTGVAFCVTATTALLGLVAARLFELTPQLPRPRTSMLQLTLSLAPMILVGSTLIDIHSPMAVLSLAGLTMASLVLLLAITAAARRSAQRLVDRCAIEELAAVPPRLTQRLNRQRDRAADRLTGQLRLEWLPGQQQQVVHIPFVPPFAGTPHVSCDCTAVNGSVRSRVAQVRHFGARIELRRTITNDQPEITDVTLVVTASPESQCPAA